MIDLQRHGLSIPRLVIEHSLTMDSSTQTVGIRIARDHESILSRLGRTRLNSHTERFTALLSSSSTQCVRRVFTCVQHYTNLEQNQLVQSYRKKSLCEL